MNKLKRFLAKIKIKQILKYLAVLLLGYWLCYYPSRMDLKRVFWYIYELERNQEYLVAVLDSNDLLWFNSTDATAPAKHDFYKYYPDYLDIDTIKFNGLHAGGFVIEYKHAANYFKYGFALGTGGDPHYEYSVEVR